MLSSRSRSRSLGGSLNEESEDRISDFGSSSSRIVGGFFDGNMSGNGDVMSRIVFVLRLGMSDLGAVQKYLDVTSSLGVTPGKSLEIKNPSPTPSGQVTMARISTERCSWIEMSGSTLALTQLYEFVVEELTWAPIHWSCSQSHLA